MLTKVEEVIKELGGATAVAKMIGVTVPAVSNAKERNSFPHRWRMRIFEEVERRGIAIAPDLVGREF